MRNLKQSLLMLAENLFGHDEERTAAVFNTMATSIEKWPSYALITADDNSSSARVCVSEVVWGPGNPSED